MGLWKKEDSRLKFVVRYAHCAFLLRLRGQSPVSVHALFLQSETFTNSKSL
jgi:hypothetical protein